MDSNIQTITKTNKRFYVPPSPYPIYISVAFFFFSYSIGSQLVCESVIYNKVCYDHFTNVSLCSNTAFSKNHPDLQKDAATWSIYVAAVQILPAVLVNLLLSSYCDSVGHRFPMALSACGIVLTSGWLAVMATPSLYNLPTSLILLYGVFNGICGGNPLMLMSSYSYLTWVSTKENLAIAMAALEGAVEFGLLAGTLVSGPIADNFGLYNLAYLNIGLSIIPILVILCLTTEISREDKTNKCWRDAIGVQHIFNAFHCVFKTRKDYNRLLINLCYISVYAVSVACAGYTTLSFLYFVKEIGMSLTELSIFSGYLMAVKGLGGPIILAIVKRTNANNMDVAVFSCAGVALAYIIMSIDAIPYSIWLGGTLLAFQSVVYALIRAFQVTLVDESEVGKIFAYDGIFQVFFSLVTVMFYKELYSLTVLAWPAFFLAFCASLCCISMIVTICMTKLETREVVSAIESDTDDLRSDTVT